MKIRTYNLHHYKAFEKSFKMMYYNADFDERKILTKKAWIFFGDQKVWSIYHLKGFFISLLMVQVVSSYLHLLLRNKHLKLGFLKSLLMDRILKTFKKLGLWITMVDNLYFQQNRTVRLKDIWFWPNFYYNENVKNWIFHFFNVLITIYIPLEQKIFDFQHF